MINEQIHDFRKYIDVAIVEAENLEDKKIYEIVESEKEIKADRELEAIEQVVIKLKEAKMWAGKILEARGSELPKEFRDKAE